MPDDKQTYRVTAGCWNCGEKQRQYDIPQGQSVGNTKCGNCGVKGCLHRIEDEVLLSVDAGV